MDFAAERLDIAPPAVAPICLSCEPPLPTTTAFLTVALDQNLLVNDRRAVSRAFPLRSLPR